MQAIEKTKKKKKKKKKKKRFTQDQKHKILNELSFGSMTILSLARKHGIAPVTLHFWKRTMTDSKIPNQDSEYKEVLTENDKLKIENENLKKALGEKAIDNQILKAHGEVLKKRHREQQ